MTPLFLFYYMIAFAGGLALIGGVLLVLCLLFLAAIGDRPLSAKPPVPVSVPVDPAGN